MEKIKTVGSQTYRGRQITTEVWKVNGRERVVHALDGENAKDGHYGSIEHAQQAIRRSNWRRWLNSRS